MKIGYITKQHPKNRKAYSGIHFYMHKALKSSFDEVLPLGPVESGYKIVPKLKGKIYRFLSGKTYKYQYDIKLAKRMASIIDRKINLHPTDVLLSSLMSPEVAYLKSKIPLYITTDATFPLLNELYQSHSNLHSKSIKEAMHLEKKAFQRATKLILPLNWLADSAMKHYEIPSQKIEVVLYGVNLDTNILENEVDSVISSRRNSSVVKLLFVGIRWEEKGGPFAVEVLKSLLEKGIQAELHIVGCTPDIPDQMDQIKILGFLDKESEKDSEKLYQLYKKSSFFIMPTKAECVGMSFIEAASFGLPSIGSDIGGVPEAVVHEQTGFISTNTHSPDDVSEWIKKVWKSNDQYKKISQKSYLQYKEKMN